MLTKDPVNSSLAEIQENQIINNLLEYNLDLSPNEIKSCCSNNIDPRIARRTGDIEFQMKKLLGVKGELTDWTILAEKRLGFNVSNDLTFGIEGRFITENNQITIPSIHIVQNDLRPYRDFTILENENFGTSMKLPDSEDSYGFMLLLMDTYSKYKGDPIVDYKRKRSNLKIDLLKLEKAIPKNYKRNFYTDGCSDCSMEKNPYDEIVISFNELDGQRGTMPWQVSRYRGVLRFRDCNGKMRVGDYISVPPMPRRILNLYRKMVLTAWNDFYSHQSITQ